MSDPGGIERAWKGAVRMFIQDVSTDLPIAFIQDRGLTFGHHISHKCDPEPRGKPQSREAVTASICKA